MAIGLHGLGGIAGFYCRRMTIDQASFEPVYRQLARILREQIQAGQLLPGAALPSEASLSQNFGVGRDAVRDALACHQAAWSSAEHLARPRSAAMSPARWG